MKCLNCNKTIPNSSLICSYCGKDPNISEQVEFGGINDQIYDNKMDIKVFMKDPKNYKKVIIMFVSIILIFAVVIFAVIVGINASKLYPYEIFNSFISDFTDQVQTQIGEVYQGKYVLEIDSNKDDYIFNGEYSYDLENRYITLSGTYDDPAKKQGGIVLEEKDLNFEILYNELNLYFNSSSIYNKPLLIPLDNSSIYLSKKIDYSSIIDGVSTSLQRSLKYVNFIRGKENYKYNNQNIKADKTVLKLDNKNSYLFYKEFYQSLIEDSSFLSEYSKIMKKSEDELIKTFENYISNARLSANEQDKNFEIVVYSKRKEIYEININNMINLKIVGDKYKLKLKKDNKEYFSLDISKKDEEHQEYIQHLFDYDLTINNNNYKGTLLVKNNIDSNVNKYSFDDNKNVNELTTNEISLIKDNVNYYFKNDNYVDKLLASVKEKCNKGMNCTCEDTSICTCIYNNKMITCEYDLVN